MDAILIIQNMNLREVKALKNQSIVENKILSGDFPYLQPYFYNHPYALRCELGTGDSAEAYMENALRRAKEIYDILFPTGADAIMFNYWWYDYCDTGDPEWNNYDQVLDMEDIIQNRIDAAAENLRFLSSYQFQYRHVSVRNLETYDRPGDDDFDNQHRNRIICYSDGIGFPEDELIRREVEVVNGHEVSFVSFENECIFSIYDDRGCDIVFMTQEKMKAYYDKLKPYFLEYDLAEMQRRYDR